MDGFVALGGLFAIAFLAATVLPAQSEATLVGLQLAGYPVILLIVVASIGNTLGAVVNWALGRGVERFRDRRWFPVSTASLDRACGCFPVPAKAAPCPVPAAPRFSATLRRSNSPGMLILR